MKYQVLRRINLHAVLVLTVTVLFTGCISASQDAPIKSAQTAKADPLDLNKPSKDMVELSVVKVVDFPMGSVLVLLQEKKEPGRIVPILVGETEGRAMSRRISRQRFARPLTHDLVENILSTYHVRPTRVEIDDFKDGVFLAHLYLIDQSGQTAQIDARPSDSIVLALGIDAPIFMNVRIVNELGKSAEEWENPVGPSEETGQLIEL